MKMLTDALMKTQANTINSNVMYMNSTTYDMLWDILYEKFIDIYGVRQIGKQDDMFVYEGVLFDKFPDKYSTLFCTYLNDNYSSICEEIELIELTDTKIVFKLSFLIPKEETNITIEWN